jgi:L-lactate utilization protein LutB
VHDSAALHIVVTSIEKMVPSLADLPKFRLLRSCDRAGDHHAHVGDNRDQEARRSTGAQEMHIVLRTAADPT